MQGDGDFLKVTNQYAGKNIFRFHLKRGDLNISGTGSQKH